MKRILFTLFAVLCLLMADAVSPAATVAACLDQTGETGDKTEQLETNARFAVKLADGRFRLRGLLKGMYESLGLKPPKSLDDLNWTIDARTIPGKARIESLDRITGGVIVPEVEGDRVLITLDRAAVKAAVADAETDTEHWLDSFETMLVWWHGRARGLTFEMDDVKRASIRRYFAQREAPPERVIVLVHGLDDPGWMFDDIAPALRRAGYEVARVEYPNDGPIVESADVLALCLMELKQRGVKRVDIVAHSMGGLVTRDVLTREAYYAGDWSGGNSGHNTGDDPGTNPGTNSGGGRFPIVDRLIMCGTPNHGSKMARLRAISEIKEHFSRAISGEGTLLGGFSDGSGEAARDLLPGSDCLKRLNAKPLATHTRYTIIAGRASPLAGDEVGSVARKVRTAARWANAPKWLLDGIAKAEKGGAELLDEAVRDIGDGCVTIDSARLEGVDDFIIVEANHVSLIVNIMPGSETTPPAIPIILDRLRDDQP